MWTEKIELNCLSSIVSLPIGAAIYLHVSSALGPPLPALNRTKQENETRQPELRVKPTSLHWVIEAQWIPVMLHRASGHSMWTAIPLTLACLPL